MASWLFLAAAPFLGEPGGEDVATQGIERAVAPFSSSSKVHFLGFGEPDGNAGVFLGFVAFCHKRRMPTADNG